jgi:thioredoxin 1
MASKKVKDVDVNNFAAEVTGPGVALVDFTAAWCAPCRTIAPHVEAIAEAYDGRLRVAKIDVDENPELAARYEVRSMPTLLLFRDGQVIGQIVGAVPRARIEALVAGAVSAARA